MPDPPAILPQVKSQELTRPRPEVLQLYRYLWQPALYAHPEWLQMLGFHPANGWCYGQQPPLDRCLDHALRALRGTPVISSCLNQRQQRLVDLAPRMTSFALGMGLVKIGRSEYFMLPDYRQELHQWLDDDEIWRLFGWCGQGNRLLLPPTTMIQTAIQIGTALLHRAAGDEPVLQAQLILLPPPKRALWPRTSLAELSLLEHIL